MKSMIFIFQLLIWTSLSMHAASAGAAEEVRKVLIGFGGPLTEASTQSGRNAALLAIQEVNTQSIRIAGKKLVFELLEQDDKADPNIAVLSANYLVASKVVGVVGHWNTAASLATAKIYSDAGIAQISPASTGTRYTALGYQTTFRMVGHDSMRSAYIAEYALMAQKVKRIAVIDDGTAFGVAIADQMISFLQINGGVLAARTTVTNKTSDYKPALDAIRQTQPDLIFHAGVLHFGHLDHGNDLIRSVKRMGFPKKMILAESTTDPEVLQELGAADIDVFAISPGLPPDRLPGWKTFEKNYTARFNSRITSYTPAAYDAVYVLVNAIKLANSVDSAAVVAAIHKIRFAGLSGAIAFDRKGDIVKPVYTVYQIKQSNWTPIQVIGQ